MSVDMSELISYRDKLKNISDEYEVFLRKFLLKQALDVLAKTKKNSPTITGLLKNSWTIGNQTLVLGSKIPKSGKNKGKIKYFVQEISQNATIDDIVKNGDTLTISISNPVEYAGYVEYGHMDRSGKKWVKGQFMCSLAIIDVKKKIPARYKKEFEAWLSQLNTQ